MPWHDDRLERSSCSRKVTRGLRRCGAATQASDLREYGGLGGEEKRDTRSAVSINKAAGRSGVQSLELGNQ